jgi:hypothetical protein
LKNKKKRKTQKPQPKKKTSAAAADESRSKKKFSQNFWASTGMTQSFLGSFAKAQKSYQKGRVFPLDQFWGVFLNPTKLVGFICPTKKVGLIFGRPRFWI